ncbi:hypothetical protein ACXYTJ_12295 [Gilvimarinus sp. F26214L]|uniref:hypothetical protein n=1 Tax=Gilvimarinus sp. DZF01 TaxID=3461371 RepID=UPI00404647B4
MKRFLKSLSVATVVLLFAACSTAPSLQDQLMAGQWEGEMQGFPLTLEYTETDINVVGMGMSLPYKLEGDEMSFEVPGQGTMVMKISIDGDTLTQTDVATGQSTTLTRVM